MNAKLNDVFTRPSIDYSLKDKRSVPAKNFARLKVLRRSDDDLLRFSFAVRCLLNNAFPFHCSGWLSEVDMQRPEWTILLPEDTHAEGGVDAATRKQRYRTSHKYVWIKTLTKCYRLVACYASAYL